LKDKAKRKVLILSYSDLKSDPRVRKQIKALINNYEITACGFENPGIEGLEFIPIFNKKKKRLITPSFHQGYPVLLRKPISFVIKRINRSRENRSRRNFENRETINDTEKRYWSPDKLDFLEMLSGKKFDAIIANDIDTLPLAVKIAGNDSRVIFDSHEYAPAQCDDDEHWVRFTQGYITELCTKYLGRADKIFTVCESIAQEYRNRFSVDPIVVTNAADFADLKPNPTNKDRIKVIHHGAAKSSRKLEDMFELVDHLDERFELYMMLVPTNKGYLEDLKIRYGENRRIHFVDPVPSDLISSEINKYDIGLFLLKPVNTNYRYALPNKLFEFIQARLCIAIGPSVEMAGTVKKYELGITAEDFDLKTVALRLNKLTHDEIDHYKNQSHRYARELSSEKNLELINKTVEALLNK
jgi:hypothetical protein